MNGTNWSPGNIWWTRLKRSGKNVYTSKCVHNAMFSTFSVQSGNAGIHVMCNGLCRRYTHSFWKQTQKKKQNTHIQISVVKYDCVRTLVVRFQMHIWNGEARNEIEINEPTKWEKCRYMYISNGLAIEWALMACNKRQPRVMTGHRNAQLFFYHALTSSDKNKKQCIVAQHTHQQMLLVLTHIQIYIYFVSVRDCWWSRGHTVVARHGNGSRLSCVKYSRRVSILYYIVGHQNGRSVEEKHIFVEWWTAKGIFDSYILTGIDKK